MQKRNILLSMLLCLASPAAGPDAIVHAGETVAEPSPAGSVSGTLLLESGTPPKNGVVYIEGVPANQFAVPAEKVTISQRGARFRPDFVVAVAGQTVEMPNDDRITHNVFSVSPTKKFDLGHYPQGQMRTVKFDKAGVVELFCNIHENMQAVIVVAPSPHFSTLAADGQWSIGSIPPGKYKIIAFAPGIGQESSAIEIKSGQAITMNLKLPGK
jgi:plastocyanin